MDTQAAKKAAESGLIEANNLRLRNGASEANLKALAALKGDFRTIVTDLTEQVPPEPEPPISTYPPVKPDIGSWSKISDFPEKLVFPGRAIEVADPAGSGRKVVSLTAANTDTGNPTPNPRAQLGTAYLLKPESEFWLRTRLWFPDNFPTFSGTWMTLVSMWAPPYGGDGAPFHFMTWDGQTLRVERNSNHGDDTPLWIPITRGKWMDLLWHGYLSKDSSKGFGEVWLNGEPQTFKTGGTRLQMVTIDNTNSGGNQNVRLEVYYKLNGIPNRQPITVLFDGLHIGTTKASVGA